MKSDTEKKILTDIRQLIEKNSPQNLENDKIRQESLEADFMAQPKFFRNANFRFVVLIIGMIIFFTFSVAAFATDFFNSSIFDPGIQGAVMNGLVNDMTISDESNGVKVEITGTVSDKSRTVFEIKFYGLNKTNNTLVRLKNLKLMDDEGNHYQFNRCGGGDQSTEEVVVNSLEFYGGPGKDTNLYLSFNGVDNVDGIWNFKIPVKYFAEKVYKTNIKYETNHEVWIIDKISSYSSKTVVERTIEKTKDWNFTMELAAGTNISKGFHCVVPDRKFPTRFQYDLEPLYIDGDVKLYIVDFDSTNRAIIDIPFDQLQEISH